MTIQSFKTMSKGTVSLRANGSLGAQITYLVTSDDVDESQFAILNHASCPVQHVTGHPDNSNVICRDIDVEEYQGNDYKWVVIADFDSFEQRDKNEKNATDDVVEGGIRGITEDVPTFFDTFGNPLVNDAGDYFEGLTKKHRLIVCPVTAFSTSVPWALFTELNGTVNDADITIHGVTFPAGTALLEDPDMPARPLFSKNGTRYWKYSFRITINADGWVSILPNRGFCHYIYQTRTSTTAPWEDSGYDAYTAEGTANLKRRIKVAITDEGESDVPSNMWLNNHGEKMLASFDVINGTCNTTAGSTTLASVSPTLTADDIGKYVVITGAGYQGRKLRARIETTSTISVPAQTTGTGLVIKGGGAWCKSYQIEDLADWTAVPLPNNHT